MTSERKFQITFWAAVLFVAAVLLFQAWVYHVLGLEYR